MSEATMTMDKGLDHTIIGESTKSFIDGQKGVLEYVGIDIDSLARTMIELSGMVPDRDISVEYTGLKTGEKLTEILSSSEEELSATSSEKINLVRNTGPGISDLGQIDEFIQSARNLTDDEVKEGIRRIVSDYTISGIDD